MEEDTLPSMEGTCPLSFKPLKPPTLLDTFAAVRIALDTAQGAAVRHDGTEHTVLDQRAHTIGHPAGDGVAVHVEVL